MNEKMQQLQRDVDERHDRMARLLKEVEPVVRALEGRELFHGLSWSSYPDIPGARSNDCVVVTLWMGRKGRIDDHGRKHHGTLYLIFGMPPDGQAWVRCMYDGHSDLQPKLDRALEDVWHPIGSAPGVAVAKAFVGWKAD